MLHKEKAGLHNCPSSTKYLTYISLSIFPPACQLVQQSTDSPKKEPQILMALGRSGIQHVDWLLQNNATMWYPRPHYPKQNTVTNTNGTKERLVKHHWLIKTCDKLMCEQMLAENVNKDGRHGSKQECV